MASAQIAGMKAFEELGQDGVKPISYREILKMALRRIVNERAFVYKGSGLT
ncbi:MULTISPECIES: hypothetical protein [Burkholderia]|jgi:hypothetical protein|uniref:Uncharacterized protein n=1 Tax=Burkholderia contaminans TaxID=488447 RepID=A0AAP1Y8X6_9BURK|nr:MULTISPECIES: hypothetical protein [Burkholderia]UTP26656.1 hypothetical protein NMB33_36810 [Burkholderia sp. FXe9]MBH9688706.1 hypothetical protein [Burkholderia contaminans]MBK1900616.1 hypothetical protein [Burkholderia contaminans]MBK1909059.1 hypothetical protein [Burkholderia contaminans]MBK1926208.1 hypothetical protein [Burkholderia contaminans]